MGSLDTDYHDEYIFCGNGKNNCDKKGQTTKTPMPGAQIYLALKLACLHSYKKKIMTDCIIYAQLKFISHNSRHWEVCDQGTSRLDVQ